MTSPASTPETVESTHTSAVFPSDRPELVEAPWVIALLVAVGTIIELVRVSAHGGAWHTLWAEDGAIFLTQQHEVGFLRALFTNYNGYGDLVPRILAGINSAFPLSWSSYLVALESTFISAVCATTIYVASRSLITSRSLRAFLFLAFLMLPILRVESLANTCNLQWFMVPAAAWLVIWRPDSPRAQWFSAIFVGATIASTPLALALLPLMAYRYWRVRGRSDLTLLVSAVVGSVFQGIVMARDFAAQQTTSVHATVKIIAQAYSLRVVVASFGGISLTTRIFRHGHYAFAYVALVTVVIVAAVLFPRLGGGRREWMLVFLLGSFGIFALSYAVRGVPHLLLTPMQAVADSARYSIVPIMLFLFAVALMTQWATQRVRALRWVAAGIFVVVLISWLPTQSTLLNRRPISTWQQQISLARHECATSTDVATLAITPVPWRAHVPCGDL